MLGSTCPTPRKQLQSHSSHHLKMSPTMSLKMNLSSNFVSEENLAEFAKGLVLINTSKSTIKWALKYFTTERGKIGVVSAY